MRIIKELLNIMIENIKYYYIYLYFYNYFQRNKLINFKYLKIKLIIEILKMSDIIIFYI